MQREFVAVPDYWNVGQTVDYLRAHPDLPEDFYDIFLIDPRFKVVGDVPLSRLLRSRRAVALADIKYKELRTFPAETDQEEVARAFHRYALVSAPVVDADGRLLGVITVDDVVDVIDEEAEDDILKLGGVSADDTYVPALQTSLKRLPWLGVNLFTALMGVFVITQFEGTIAKLVSLAALMPMVAGMGGNAGTQALTVTVRALAAGEITAATAWRALRKELAVGAVNGITFLVAGGALAFAWFHDPVLAAVFGSALLINLVVAAVVGTTVPLVLNRLGQDPAVSSSVFLTAITDVVGFFGVPGAGQPVPAVGFAISCPLFRRRRGLDRSAIKPGGGSSCEASLPPRPHLPHALPLVRSASMRHQHDEQRPVLLCSFQRAHQAPVPDPQLPVSLQRSLAGLEVGGAGPRCATAPARGQAALAWRRPA